MTPVPSGTTLHFYATPMELASLVSSVLANPNTRALAVTYPPFVARELIDTEVPNIVVDDSADRRVLFTTGEPDLGDAMLKLLEANPSAAILDLGRRNEKELEESRLFAPRGGPWRGALAAVRDMTSAGGTGVNENSGASAQYRYIRFSNGARELWRAGTVLRPFFTSPVAMHPDGPDGHGGTPAHRSG